jgi:Zn-finger protein
MSTQRPPVDYLKIVPVEIFCQFWKQYGCVPASYLAPAVKIQKAKQNIFNCANCIIIDTMDFDASILLKLKNLEQVCVQTKWVKNTPLSNVLTKLYKQGVHITIGKVTPRTLVNCELFDLIPVIIPTYTYKDIEELVYMLLNSPQPGVKKCITCIIKHKPQLKSQIKATVQYAISYEYVKPKPDKKKIKLLSGILSK